MIFRWYGVRIAAMAAGLISALALGAAETEKPFVWTAAAKGGQLEVLVSVAENCYLYAAATTVSAVGGDGQTIGGWTIPVAVEKIDPFSKQPEKVYTAGTHRWTAPADNGNYTVKVEYQGCRNAVGDRSAVCFMPAVETLTGGTAAGIQPVAPAVPAENAGDFSIVKKGEGLLDAAAFTAFLRDGGTTESARPFAGRGALWIVFFALLAGMGLNLTPCILPLIPINLAIIGAAGSGWKTGAWRATVYGLGMALAYGVVGAAVVLTGARFGTLNSSSWFNFAIAGIFLLLALAMFGAFNLDFSRFSAKFDPTRQPRGKLAVIFALGAVAALLAGACVAPVLIAVIMLSADLYAAGQWIGLLLPFVLGIGMALPWPPAGAGLAVLPKPGAWMNRIKYVFGIIILAAAAYYGHLGWTLRPGTFDAGREIAGFETALAESRRTGRPVLVDFWATWCKNCKTMESTVFTDPAVKAELTRFVVVKVQAEKLDDPRIKALLDRFGFSGLPAFAVVRPD